MSTSCSDEYCPESCQFSSSEDSNGSIEQEFKVFHSNLMVSMECGTYDNNANMKVTTNGRREVKEEPLEPNEEQYSFLTANSPILFTDMQLWPTVSPNVPYKCHQTNADREFTITSTISSQTDQLCRKKMKKRVLGKVSMKRIMKTLGKKCVKFKKRLLKRVKKVLRDKSVNKNIVAVGVKSQLDKKDHEISTVRRELEEMKQQNRRLRREKFFLQTNLEALRHTDMLKKLCGILSKTTEKDEGPFAHINRLDKKEKLLLDYFDTFQQNLHPAGGCDIRPQERITAWFSTNWVKFMYRVPKCDQPSISQCFYDSFGVEGVLGTIHRLPFKYNDWIFIYMFLVVVEQRIVTWSSHADEIVAFDQLAYYVSKFPWSREYKLATPVYKGEFSPAFIHVPRTDIYEKNEKVVQWMHNNFKCLQYPVYADINQSFPVLYNLAIGSANL